MFSAIQESKSKYSENCYDLIYILLKSVTVSIAHYFFTPIITFQQKEIFSDSPKAASVIPPSEDGEKFEPNKFHPLSNLPTLEKVLEKLYIFAFAIGTKMRTNHD